MFPSWENNTAYSSLAMCTDVLDISYLITGNYSMNNYTLPSDLVTFTSTVFTMADVSSMIKVDERLPMVALQALILNKLLRPCNGPDDLSRECLAQL